MPDSVNTDIEEAEPTDAIEDEPEEAEEEGKEEEEEESEDDPPEEAEGENEPPAPQEEPKEGETEKEGENTPPKDNEPDDKLWKLTINGEEKEFSTGDVVERAQKAESAEQRFQEAAEYTRSARQVVDMVSQNPIETAIRLKTGMYGGDRAKAEQEIYDVAAKFVMNRLQEELLPEEQREFLRKERELGYKAEQIEQAQQKLKADEEQREMQVAYAEADKEIAAAVEKSKLPQEPEVFDRMMRIMQRHYDAGKDLTALQAAEIVKQQLDKETPDMLEKLSPEELHKRNPDFLKKMREYDLKLAQEKKARSSTQNDKARVKGKSKTSTKARGRVGAKEENWNDFFDAY